MEICFDNREANIGRFIYRHLSTIDLEQLDLIGSFLTKRLTPKKSVQEQLAIYLEECEKRYDKILKDKKATPHNYGNLEVGLIITGEVPEHGLSQDFLNLLSSTNPMAFGSTIWFDTRQFGQSFQPYVIDGTWEALYIPPGCKDDIKFMRFDPKGRFFSKSTLWEDVKRNDKSPDPCTVMYADIAIYQIVAAISTGISFAKAMGCLLDETSLAYIFKWTKLKGRTISSSSLNELFIVPSDNYIAYQDELVKELEIPLNIPLSSIGKYVYKIVKSLLELFNGYQLSEQFIEQKTNQIVQRRF